MTAINITISYLPTGREVNVQLEDSITVNQLMGVLPHILNRRDYRGEWTVFMDGNPPLYGDISLQDSGVENGSVLKVVSSVRAGGGVFFREFRDIQFIEAIIRHSNVIQSLTGWILFSVFLYTTEDEKLALYLRDHVADLHKMSGNRCMFFAIEKPSNEWIQSARNYLGAFLGKQLDEVWEQLGPDSFRPFDKTEAYSIARNFNLLPRQLPCIIFFTNLESTTFLVVELGDYIRLSSANTWEFSRFFRDLFSCTQEALALESGDKLVTLSNIIAENMNKDASSIVKNNITFIEIMNKVTQQQQYGGIRFEGSSTIQGPVAGGNITSTNATPQDDVASSPNDTRPTDQ